MAFWNKLPLPIIGLSPMDGFTDAAFRFITARHGRPDVCFTEFTAVERIARGHDLDLTDLRYDPIERPVVAQVFGADPEAFYRVAHVVCELGFDGLDINMGCPSKSIAGRGAGAGLIQTPELARRIIRRTRDGVRDWAAGQTLSKAGLPESAVAAVAPRRIPRAGTVRAEIPVSVKTRLGYREIVIDEWMRYLLSESPDAISIHGRTLAQLYRGEADWEAIARAAEIARGSGTLVLGNGDLRSPSDAVRRLRETAVDGVLLGRVAIGCPWIFRTAGGIREAVRNGSAPPAEPVVSLAAKLGVALEHADCFGRINPERSYRSVRKFLSAYCRGFPNAASVRRRLVQCDSFPEVASVLRPMIDGAVPLAESVSPVPSEESCA
jgi:nifR3 family TIM-barrel protein